MVNFTLMNASLLLSTVRVFLLSVPLLTVSCVAPAYQQQGWASCIASNYQGRRTASGQIYQSQQYTAAHNNLPFGTRATVTNLYNNRSVNVTINDRYPPQRGRIINLSGAAAYALGIPYNRMGQVQVTAYQLPQNSRTTYGYGGYPRRQVPPPSTQPGYRSNPYRSNVRRGATPNAPSYRGGNAPPAGLGTF
jgi:rare lipoprotein A (peptidoglycan hydrolase)